MKRATRYLLVGLLTLAGSLSAAKLSGAPLRAPVAAFQELDPETEKYNRKLNDVEARRVRDHQKLEAEYAKLLQKRQTMDLRKFQERLDKFRVRRDKIEERYHRSLAKLEREQARKR